jgi:hypothetical protein
MLLDHGNNLRTRAGNIDTFIAKQISKYPDKQGVDEHGVEGQMTTTITYNILKVIY